MSNAVNTFISILSPVINLWCEKNFEDGMGLSNDTNDVIQLKQF